MASSKQRGDFSDVDYVIDFGPSIDITFHDQRPLRLPKSPSAASVRLLPRSQIAKSTRAMFDSIPIKHVLIDADVSFGWLGLGPQDFGSATLRWAARRSKHNLVLASGTSPQIEEKLHRAISSDDNVLLIMTRLHRVEEWARCVMSSDRDPNAECSLLLPEVK